MIMRKPKILSLILSLVIPLLLSILLPSCSNNHTTEIQNYKGNKISRDTIDIFLKTKMDSLKIPGLSIAIINDGKVVYRNSLGYANVEEKLPVTEKTIFEGASMSKPVFAFFVMTYVEEGKLDLDKPLYEYLPYPDIEYDDRYKKITARMVLSHQSGFPNWRENEPDDKLKIKFDPGTGYEYSGEGYQYLAMVLKHILGTDWNGLEAAFQERVAEPLGMEHTVYIQTPYTRKHKAEPYDENGKRIDWENDYWYKKGKDQFVAPASIHSEPIDFSRWMIAMMKKELLKDESYQELFKHQVAIPNSDVNPSYYTLGLMTRDDPYANLYFHSGNNEGFTCLFVLDTEKDWGYVIFTNSEFGSRLGGQLFDFFDEEKK
jgi:CubicO group peptidase (beta-lactamase class C family)